jgi:AraC-like DNA-binding protein/mannose-6-phosphate isomerase-like protein (cupin superfamily)
MPIYRESIQTLPDQSVRLLRWSSSLADVRICVSPRRSLPLDGSGARWHAHRQVELTYVHSGTGVRFCGDHIGEINSPELVLIGADVPHYWSGLRESNGVALQWDIGPSGPLAALRETAKLNPLWEASRRGLLFPKRVAVSVGEVLRDLPRRSNLRRLAELLGVLDQLASGERHATRLSSKPFVVGSHAAHADTVSRTIDLLLGHFHEALSLDDLSQAVGVSRATLCREFRRYTGRSVVAFLNEVRIDHAKRRLIESDESVAAIALVVGFTNLSNFNRRFKEVVGISPRAYRREHAIAL